MLTWSEILVIIIRHASRCIDGSIQNKIKRLDVNESTTLASTLLRLRNILVAVCWICVNWHYIATTSTAFKYGVILVSIDCLATDLSTQFVVPTQEMSNYVKCMFPIINWFIILLLLWYRWSTKWTIGTSRSSTEQTLSHECINYSSTCAMCPQTS